MRRLLATVLLACLVLTGCGSSGSTSLSDVTVSGKPGAKPTVKFEGVYTATKTVTKVLKPGTGATVKMGDKVAVNYIGINGKDDKEFDSSFNPKQPTEFTLADGALIKGFISALKGSKVGSRILVAIPPADGYGTSGQPSAGIGKDDTLLFVIDVLGARTVLSRAQGKALPQTAGNPTVTLDAKGVPTISKPVGPPPTKLVISPLIQGTGAKVKTGQTITVNYSVSAWSDGHVIESSWQKGSPAELSVGQGQLLPGLDAGLVGQPVGSQVLVVVPQPDGIQTPSTATASPKPAVVKPDALVFVIDILDAS